MIRNFTFFTFGFALLMLVSLWPGAEVISAQTASESASSQKAEESPSEAPPSDNPINLTLSPVTLYLTTTPGKAVDTEIKLRNNNTDTEHLKIEIGTFSAGPEGDKPVLRDPTDADTFINWLQISERRFSVSPGEWKTIPVSFTPPAEASLSYYYTIIVSRDTTLSAPGATAVEGAPALLVLTTVETPFAKRQLEVTSFKSKSAFVEYLPQEFEVMVKNTGNVHLSPAGNIFIDSSGNKDVAVLSFNPTVGNVLPGSERLFTVKWDDGFPTYQADEKGDQKLRWDLSKADRFRFGKYTANLLLVYDDGQRDVPVSSQISFWVIPWKILLGVLFVLLLVGVGLRSIVLGLVRKPHKQ